MVKCKFNFYVIDHLLRIVLFFISLAAVVSLALFWNVEIDLGFSATGVLDCRENISVYAHTDVIVNKVLVPYKKAVEKGAPVLILTAWDHRSKNDMSRLRKTGLESCLERLTKASLTGQTMLALGKGNDFKTSSGPIQYFAARDRSSNSSENLSAALREIEATDCLLGQETKFLNFLEQTLATATITAPFDGFILTPELETAQGKLFRKGERLVTFGIKEKLHLYCSIEEKHFEKINVGQKALIYPAVFPKGTNKPVIGRIIGINPVNPESLMMSADNYRRQPAYFTAVISFVQQQTATLPLSLNKIAPGNTARVKIITKRERVFKIVMNKLFG